MSAQERIDAPAYDAEGQLLRLLTDAQAATARLFDARAEHLGLNRIQWRVVGGIHRRPGLTQTELANWLGIARSPLAKVIDQLESAGLVERRPDASDRRINRMHVTAKVEEMVGPTTSLSRKLENQALEGLADPAGFMRELTRITERLEAMVAAELKSR